MPAITYKNLSTESTTMTTVLFCFLMMECLRDSLKFTLVFRALRFSFLFISYFSVTGVFSHLCGIDIYIFIHRQVAQNKKNKIQKIKKQR